MFHFILDAETAIKLANSDGDITMQKLREKLKL